MSKSAAVQMMEEADQSIEMVKKIQQLKEAMEPLRNFSAESVQLSELVQRMELDASEHVKNNVLALQVLMAPPPVEKPADPIIGSYLHAVEIDHADAPSTPADSTELPNQIAVATEGLMAAIKQITGAASKMVVSAEKMQLKATRGALILAMLAGATAGLVMGGVSVAASVISAHTERAMQRPAVSVAQPPAPPKVATALPVIAAPLPSPALPNIYQVPPGAITHRPSHPVK